MNNRKYFVISLLLFILGIVFLVAGVYCVRCLPNTSLEVQTIREQYLVGGATLGFMLGVIGIVGAAITTVMGIANED